MNKIPALFVTIAADYASGCCPVTMLADLQFLKTDIIGLDQYIFQINTSFHANTATSQAISKHCEYHSRSDPLSRHAFVLRLAKMKLIMTLVCRNEVDIIRQNIEFHLAHGVDHVLATDHASVDGTRDILAEYARLGVLTVIDEATRAFPQADWMTRMAHLAREQNGADWILNNDADEFWYPASGSLKNVISATHAAILRCHRFNMVYPYDADSCDSWFNRLVYRVATPEPIPRMLDRYEDTLPVPYFYFNLPPKVMTRTKYLTTIGPGNHDASFSESVNYQCAAVNIFHFPIRSVPQFFRKITQSAQSILLDQNLPRYQSWHIRRWYRVIRERSIHTALAEALPSNRQLRQDLKIGRLVEDRTIQNYFHDL